MRQAWRLESDPSSAVAVLWFDRPERSQNSLDEDALIELGARLDEIPPTAKVVAVRSAKPKGFCAGADLKRIASCRSTDEMIGFLRLGRTVLDRLRRVPAVAVVHGVCLGGGLELALACRARVALDAEPPATFGLPEVRLGLIPGWNGVALLAESLDRDDVLRLLLRGESIDAAEARRIGLIDDVLPPNESALTRWLTDYASTSRPFPKKTSKPIAPDDLQTLRESPAADLAKEAILDVLETWNEQGVEASWDQAIEKLASLVFSDRGREALARFSTTRAARPD